MNLEAQLTFLRELDKLKSVMRQTVLVDGTRKENTAEHTWHAAMAALTLAEYADEPIDIAHVIKMLLIHDIIEIDAGDTFAFDEVGYIDKEEREHKAAARIFSLLPAAQAEAYTALWLEFEAVESPEAKFANGIDRIMPFLHNAWTDGAGSWKEHQPTYKQVYARNQGGVGAVSTELWAYVQRMLDRAVQNGWLRE